MEFVVRLGLKQFSFEKLRENEAEECAICLEDYINGEQLRVLPCKHDFHTYCVDAWLTTQKKFVSLFVSFPKCVYINLYTSVLFVNEI